MARHLPATRQTIQLGALIRDQRGWVLLQRPRGKKVAWHLPLGGIGWYESPEDAIRRYVWETTGLIIAVEELLPKVHSAILKSARQSLHQLTAYFRAQYVGGELQTMTATCENRFWDPRVIQDVLPDTRNILKKFAKV